MGLGVVCIVQLGLGPGDGDTDIDGDGDGVADGLGLGFGEGDGLGLAVGLGDGFGEGAGLVWAASTAMDVLDDAEAPAASGKTMAGKANINAPTAIAAIVARRFIPICILLLRAIGLLDQGGQHREKPPA